jgi:hypothetical protein
VAGCTADCFDAGVTNIHGFVSSNSGRVSLAEQNSAPILITYSATASTVTPIPYDTSHSPPTIYSITINKEGSLFFSLKFYSPAQGAEVYGHSYFSEESPINDAAFHQTTLTNAPGDFQWHNHILTFRIPAEHAIYMLDDGSNGSVPFVGKN